MAIAYFDCFAGASGDMALGALVHVGLPLGQLQSALRRLPLGGYHLEARTERRGPISGTRLSVVLEPPPGGQGRRTLADIETLLAAADLSRNVKEAALRVFRRLAAAEARIHGIPVPQIHFHEVGATDAIVDVVGTLVGLELLEVEQVYCSPLPGGPGTVASSHGVLPLPAPATLELMAEVGAPLAPPPAGIEGVGEMVTPTAAALLSTIAVFQQPPLLLERVGYGVGARDHPALPNVLRLWLGQAQYDAAAQDDQLSTRQVQLLETNIDDMNPELFGYVAERLFQEGALDVWYTSIQMKKSRPGTQLNVLALPEHTAALVALILHETSTLGVRTRTLTRWEAQREVQRFESSLGTVAVKVKRLGGRVVHIAPEYEDCRALAQRHSLPLAQIYRRVEAEGWARLRGDSP